MIPAVSYLRMSTDAQEASIPAQRKAVQQYAAKHGYRIIREYVDAGISGDDTSKRVQFLAMLADSSHGDFKAILCWDQDRFGRFDLMEAGYWIKPLRDAGVSLVTVSQGKIDWNDFAGRLVYSIQQEGKHQFLRDLSRNVNRGKLAQAQLGKWMGGAAPYGYRLDGKATLAIDDDQAEAVRLIFELTAEGKSLTAVSRELNRRSIPGPVGGPWTRKAVTRIVDNILYCGHARYNRTSQARYSTVVAGTIVARSSSGKEVINDQSAWTVVKNAHPAIVTDSLFAKASKVRRSPNGWHGRPSSHAILFRNILKCGRCGRSMHGAWVAVMGDVVYVCSAYTETRQCDSNRTYQQPLLKAVASHIRDALLDPVAIAKARDKVLSAAASVAPSNIPSIQKRRNATQARIAALEKRLGEVPPDMIQVIADQIRANRDQVTSLEQQIELARVPVASRNKEATAGFTEFVRLLRSAFDAIQDGESPNVAELLRETFTQVTVTSEKADSNQPKGRYEITGISVSVKYAAFLS